MKTRRRTQKEGQKFARMCSICGAGMDSGYVVGDGDSYYCSDRCLRRHYTGKQWERCHRDGFGYWTEWDDASDLQYVVSGGRLVEAA